MNLTLGTLAELKAHLLTAALRPGTDYDAAIAALGLGVAGIFEQRTRRKFGRVVDDIYVTNADRAHLVLPRYPVEAISKIELQESLADGWVDQGTVADVIENFSQESGLVFLGSQLSALHSARLRVTYTGGYWFDESADGSVDTSRVFDQGVVELAPGDESKAIAFSAAFTVANAADVAIALTLVSPEAGTVIPVQPSAVTTAGFTALLGFPIPAEGYTLRWTASLATALAPAPSSLPAGATARPHDLFWAWLTQCAAIWQQLDKLGIAIAQKPAVDAALARLELLPDVVATLRAYVRFSLS